MIKESYIDEFLKVLCAIYREKNGASQAMLSSWTFPYAIFVDNEQLLNIVKKTSPKGDFKEALELLYEELVKRDLIHRTIDSHFKLTPSGYAKGNMGKITKFINYFNLNQGVNTLIAILSFLISLAALYISIKKP